MIASAFAASTYGVRQNLYEINRVAKTIADPEHLPSAQDIARLKAAEHGAKMNAAVARRVERTSEYLLDILV